MNNIIRIETLGCRLNQIESEAAAQCFFKENFTVKIEPITSKSSLDENTSLVIINTCTVTQKAEQKARRLIRLALQKFPLSLIIVTGCYAQLRPEQINKIDSRVVSLGGQIKSRILKIPSLLKEYLNCNKWNPVFFKELIILKIISPSQVKLHYPENSFDLSCSSFIAHSRASLKIQDGCNNNCSYCAIHIARGHSVSIDPKLAIKRVVELEEKGYDEVVITTINIGQYKANYEDKELNFTKLLALLLENTSKIKFRISSLYPEIVDDEFCKVISNDRVQPHFHISVQSGSNKILKLMNRIYNRDDVINACKKISNAKNNPFLACDIITGFPGETDEDFLQTIDLCKKCNFTWIHAFPYSERPGTNAIRLPNKVPQNIAGKRAKELNELSINNKIEYIKLFINKPLDAILETVKPSRVLSDKLIKYHAVTNNFLHCQIISSKKMQACKTVSIKITSPIIQNICKGGEIEAQAEFI